MDINSPRPGRLHAVFQPRVVITLGFTLAFYFLIRAFEGVKYPAYPTLSLFPQTAFLLTSFVTIGAMWWLHGRSWSYYLLAHLFAFGFGAATLVSWSPYDFGIGGVVGDAWFNTSIVVKYKAHWDNTDFAYKGLHSFYPSLYQYVVGKLALLTHTSAAKAVKYGGYWTAYLLPLAAYGLWRKVLPQLPAFLAIIVAMVISRLHLTFKPYEVISLTLFIPWALYYVMGIRLTTAEDKPAWRTEAMTRREVLIGGLIGGLLFMTFYYYFFLFVVWLPIQLLVDTREEKTFRERWQRYKLVLLLFGVIMLVAAVYWLPLLTDMAKYGMHSYQNRWFSAHMLYMPFDVSTQWRTFLGLIVLIALAPTNRLARTILVMFVALIGYLLLGHLGMYTDFPILHTRMVGVEETLLFLGFIFGIIHLFHHFKGFLDSKWEKMFPVAFMTVFCIGMAMNYMWEKGSDVTQAAANTQSPMLAMFPKFDEVSRDKVFLTNRLDLVAFKPIYLFICPNAHYSHPASRYRERLKFIVLLSKSKDPDFVAWMLQHNRYDKVDALILDYNRFDIYDDNFPEQEEHIKIPVQFQDSLFDGGYFRQDADFKEMRHVMPMPEDYWKNFTPEQQRLAALFSDVAGLQAQVPEPVLTAMKEEVRIRTKDYPTWQRVFWSRYLGGY